MNSFEKMAAAAFLAASLGGCATNKTYQSATLGGYVTKVGNILLQSPTEALLDSPGPYILCAARNNHQEIVPCGIERSPFLKLKRNGNYIVTGDHTNEELTKFAFSLLDTHFAYYAAKQTFPNPYTEQTVVEKLYTVLRSRGVEEKDLPKYCNLFSNCQSQDAKATAPGGNPTITLDR